MILEKYVSSKKLKTFYIFSGLVLAAVSLFNFYKSIGAGIVLLLCLLMPQPDINGKLRFKETILWWAVLHAVLLIMIYACGGLFFESLGYSPYNHTLAGILNNILNTGLFLAAREFVRSFFVNNNKKKENYLVFLSISVFFTVINYPFITYTGFINLKDTVIFTSNYIGPEFSKNFLSSYLAYLGGPIASLVYNILLYMFQILSPLLPNLSWVTNALIGIMVPIFSFVIIQNAYSKKTKKIKIRNRDRDGLIGWIPTSILSIAILWFVLGVFPVYPTVIATGSMEPYINPGDVIIIKKTEAEKELIKGDIIQFKKDDVLIAHRIVELIEDTEGKGYITKGDNNPSLDKEIVRLENIKGKVIQVIPKIGWPTLLIKGREDT